MPFCSLPIWGYYALMVLRKLSALTRRLDAQALHLTAMLGAMVLAVASFLAFLGNAAASEALARPTCAPVPHAVEDHQALNQFWKTKIPLCRLPQGSNSAYADLDQRVVFADQDWLDMIADRYGSWAATGVLAHEWGHLIQANTRGTAAELQADCYAGAFMRGIGLARWKVTQFAEANWDAGDRAWSRFGHGTRQQRSNAVLLGFDGFKPGMTTHQLEEVCPHTPY